MKWVSGVKLMGGTPRQKTCYAHTKEKLRPGRRHATPRQSLILSHEVKLTTNWFLLPSDSAIMDKNGEK